MTIKNGDLPAAPIGLEQAYDFDMWGFTKREMMAMHMMVSLMPEDFGSFEVQAKSAVTATDALLAELERIA